MRHIGYKGQLFYAVFMTFYTEFYRFPFYIIIKLIKNQPKASIYLKNEQIRIKKKTGSKIEQENGIKNIYRVKQMISEIEYEQYNNYVEHFLIFSMLLRYNQNKISWLDRCVVVLGVICTLLVVNCGCKIMPVSISQQESQNARLNQKQSSYANSYVTFSTSQSTPTNNMISNTGTKRDNSIVNFMKNEVIPAIEISASYMKGNEGNSQTSNYNENINVNLQGNNKAAVVKDDTWEKRDSSFSNSVDGTNRDVGFNKENFFNRQYQANPQQQQQSNAFFQITPLYPTNNMQYTQSQQYQQSQKYQQNHQYQQTMQYQQPQYIQPQSKYAPFYPQFAPYSQYPQYPQYSYYQPNQYPGFQTIPPLNQPIQFSSSSSSTSSATASSSSSSSFSQSSTYSQYPQFNSVLSSQTPQPSHFQRIQTFGQPLRSNFLQNRQQTRTSPVPQLSQRVTISQPLFSFSQPTKQLNIGSVENNDGPTRNDSSSRRTGVQKIYEQLQKNLTKSIINSITRTPNFENEITQSSPGNPKVQIRRYNVDITINGAPAGTSLPNIFNTSTNFNFPNKSTTTSLQYIKPPPPVLPKPLKPIITPISEIQEYPIPSQQPTIQPLPQNQIQTLTYQAYVLKYKPKSNSQPSQIRTFNQKIFYENINKILKHNRNPNSTYLMGINAFTDIDQNVFNTAYLTYVPTPTQIAWVYRFNFNWAGAAGQKFQIGNQESRKDKNSEVDWSCYAGRVRNQREVCGASFVVPALQSIQILQNIIRNPFQSRLGLLDLSSQQVFSCRESKECKGDFIQVFEYAKSSFIGQTKYYPYEPIEPNQLICNDMLIKNKIYKLAGAKVQEFQRLESFFCSSMLQRLRRGPLAVAIKAQKFQFYQSGTFNENYIGDVNHGVTLIGYDVSKGYLVKNHWGRGWGLGGFAYVGQEVGVCQFPRAPFSTTVPRSITPCPSKFDYRR